MLALRGVSLSAWSWCGVLKSSNALHTPSGETGLNVHIHIQLGLGWHHLVKIPESLKCSMGNLLVAFWIKGPWSLSEWSEVTCCDFKFSLTADRDSRFGSPSPTLVGHLGGLLYCLPLDCTLRRTWYNSLTGGQELGELGCCDWWGRRQEVLNLQNT